MKGQNAGPLLTSDADLDRPVIKRGRAEEEIARIRGSSYDSPSKARTFLKPPTGAPSSSPFHPFDSHPLTPGVVFKRPAKPPASVSPYTNLQNHRNRIKDLMGSPDKNLSVLPDDSNWSPAFISLPNEEEFNLNQAGFDSTFDVFTDAGLSPSDFLAARGSPEKRSAKRPCVNRAATTANILADITGAATNTRKSNSATPAAAFKKPYLKSPAQIGSPLGRYEQLAPTSTPTLGYDLNAMPSLDQEDLSFFGEVLHSDESEEGVDILQGFQKIGATTGGFSFGANVHNGSPMKQAKPSKPQRPDFGRSFTSMF